MEKGVLLYLFKGYKTDRNGDIFYASELCIIREN